MMLYFAYGSNLNIEQMAVRCPASEPLRPCTLPGFRLTFKGPLDIVADPHCSVVGALYEITEDCEESLDFFEGFPHCYTKQYFDDEFGKLGLFYSIQNRRKIQPPNPWYYDICKQGFIDWDLPVKRLNRAYAHAVKHHAKKSHVKHQQWSRSTNQFVEGMYR